MELVAIGHLVGDFYLQTSKIAEKKKTSIGYMLMHCIIYAAIIGITVVIQKGSLLSGMRPIAIISVSHILVDSTKIIIEKRWGKTSKSRCFIFLIDQCIHTAIIIGACMYYHINLAGCSIIQQNDIAYIYDIIVIVIAVLICWKPTAILISMVLAMISEAAVDTNRQEYDAQADNKENEVVGIGSWIGILEREIILFLGLLGQYSAIGFVLTAKSIARYKQLENKAFAEKYLIGTLLSAFIAIVCIAMCSFAS